MTTRRLWFAPVLLLTFALIGRGADKDQYGDPLPDGAKARCGTARLRIETFSPPLLTPDGSSLFAATNFSTTRFDPVTGAALGKVTRAFSGSFAGCSSDGNRLVHVAFGGVTVWDVKADKALAKPQRPLPDGEGAAAISADGKTLALGGVANAAKKEPVAVLVWDIDTDKERKTIAVPYNQAVKVAISADGKLLATWGVHNDPEGKGFVDPEKNLNRYVHFWEVESGKELAKFRITGYALAALTFAPDASSVAVANGNGTIDLVDPKTGTSKQTLLGLVWMGQWVAFSPDGATVAAVGNGTIRRWKVADGSILSTTEAPLPHLYNTRVRLVSNEKGIVWGTRGRTIVTWEVPSGKLLSPSSGHVSPVHWVAVSADNKFVFTSADNGAPLKWELETGKLVGPLPLRREGSYVSAATFSPDISRALARDSGYTVLYDVATNTPLYTIPTPNEGGYPTTTFSADGSKVLIATPGIPLQKVPARVAVWNVVAGKRLRLLELPNVGGLTAALTPDDKHIVTGYQKAAEKGQGDHVVAAWELETGAKKGEHTEAGDYGWPQVITGAGNKSAAVIAKRKLFAFELATGKVTKTYDLKKHDLSGPAVFSADGKRLAVACNANAFADDRPAPVLVLDWSTGDILQTLTAKGGTPNTMAFSPDGKWLVTGAPDTTTTVWDVSK